MRGTDAELLRWSLLVAVYLAVATAVFCEVEGWSAFDSFYYVVCTSTSVGFGDLVVSPDNRLLATVFMMIGATIMLSLAANVGQWVLDTIGRRRITMDFRREFEDIKTDLRSLGKDTSRLEEELDRIFHDANTVMSKTDADDLDLKGGWR